MKNRYIIISLCLLMSLLSGSSVFADENETCRTCHPGAAEQFDASVKKNFMKCTDCHGTLHTGERTGKPGIPTTKTCEKCHPEQVKQFNTSKHYEAWMSLDVIPFYKKFPKDATAKGCIPCHMIGYVWEDGSRGRCDNCHTRHLFSKEEAKKPEACRTCHSGDQPQYDMWASSKHGAVYAAHPDKGWGPTCVTCHEAHGAITAWGFLGLRPGDESDSEWREARKVVKRALKEVGLIDAPKSVRSSFEEWQDLRNKMKKRCEHCHARNFVDREMEKSDKLLRETDLEEAKIIKIIDDLYKDNVIDDEIKLKLLYESLILRINTFMGGFHHSPNAAWDKGYFKLYPEVKTYQKLGNLIHKAKKIYIIVVSVIVIIVGVIGIIFWRKLKKMT